ncbi:hypothetical protein Lalb_Chr15g0090611 [Lupinus albus]|uniref:Uncharacterized protein n=1 Tax=Lupinus albus TaxID=3870 RepID=A0A6A4PEA8_LUPAL|nr:hypothetical protein Lalb_Chr15g0090611 [Lupinus albus]
MFLSRKKDAFLSSTSIMHFLCQFNYYHYRVEASRLLGIKMATFRLHLICRWSCDEFELYIDGPDDSDVECA